LWGFANDFTNPLVKVFKDVFQISNTQSALVQAAFYGGYFTMAIPAALFIRKFSYKGAIMVGFALYAAGALLTIPASTQINFWIFLVGFYVLTFGLAFLETACNPYILAMGPPETATQRLNLAQAFNPMGSLTGMLIAMYVVAPALDISQFSDDMKAKNPSAVQYIENETQYKDGLPDFKTEYGALGGAVGLGLSNMKADAPEKFGELQLHDLGVVRTPYVVIACFALAFFAIFAFAKMPTLVEAEPDSPLF
jgi:FHS family L-fucose permease-like MFS transporter